jgi:hypothetical protein
MTHVFNELQRALACAVDAEPDLMHGVGQLFWHGVLRAVSAVCGTHVLAYGGNSSTNNISFVALDLGRMEWTSPRFGARGLKYIDTEMLRMSSGDVIIENGAFYRDQNGMLYHPETGDFTRIGSSAGSNLPGAQFLLYNMPDGRAALSSFYYQQPFFVYSRERNTWENRDVQLAWGTFANSFAAAALSTGVIFVTGGFMAGAAPSHATRRFDSVDGRVETVAPMHTARRDHAAVLLPNDRVLISGGMAYHGARYHMLNSCEIYDAATDMWQPAADSLYTHAHHRLVFLPSLNLVLALGGAEMFSATESGYTVSCEFYDVAADSWFAAPRLPRARETISAALMGGAYTLPDPAS